MRRASCITGVILPALMAALAGCGSSVCQMNELNCDGKCIAPANDDSNCGACGAECADGSACQAGVCVSILACVAPMLQCGTACIDPTTSADHCGGCDVVCAADADCISSACDGPLVLEQTSGSAATRDAFVVQDGTLDLTQLDASTFATDRVIDSALLPDGGVLLVAAEDTEGVFELYLASPRGGTLTKLSSPIVAGGSGVNAGIVVSRDGTKVLYRADQDTAGVIELYAVSIATPGTTVKVSGTLVDGGAVSRVFAIAGDGHRAAYVAEQDTADLEEAYTVDLSTTPPGASVKLNPTLTQSVFDLEMNDAGTQVVYRGQGSNGEFAALSEVDVETPGVANVIDNGDGAEGFVSDYQITSDGAVVYTSAPQELQQQLWRAPLASPFTPVLIVPRGDGTFVREFVVSRDGSQVFYRFGQALFRAPIAAPNTPVQLSLNTLTELDETADFALAANEHAIAFRAGADGAEGGAGPTPGTADPVDPGVFAPSIYVLDLTNGSATPVLLSPAVEDGHNGISDGYVVTPDERVVYRADQDTIGVVDAYLAAAATAGTTTKVSPALEAGSDSDAVSRLLAFP